LHRFEANASVPKTLYLLNGFGVFAFCGVRMKNKMVVGRRLRERCLLEMSELLLFFGLFGVFGLPGSEIRIECSLMIFC
jgi:hypothetical protein